MKLAIIFASTLALGLMMTAPDADAAKRLGGGKSSGMQREMSVPDRSPNAAPPQAPIANPAATTSRSNATAATQQAQPKRSWMGPLAGLAAGLGLAALASHFGFGEELASLMMVILLAGIVVVALAYFLKRRTAGQAPIPNGALQYSGSGNGSRSSSSYDAVFPPQGTSSSGSSALTTNIPSGFDAESFLRNAKVQYIRLQAANDAGNLDDLREFTTPEMFAELRMNISERVGVQQRTDVLEIHAELVEVVEDKTRYIASVRYTGRIREDDAAPESVDEIWHLTKPISGSTGWVLAGVQQLQ